MSYFNSLWSESDHDPVCGLTNRELFLTLAVCSLVILVEDPSNGIVPILISELELTFIGVRGHYCSRKENE